MGASLRSLLLVGMRGAGKSTAGRAAALHANTEFIDLDERALSRCAGADVASVFSAPGGEVRWRGAERDALEHAIAGARTPCIIAVGAGALDHGPTADVIRRARSTGWRVVHVRCAPQVCAARIAADPAGRPSITGADLIDEIGALHARRAPAYESVCDLVVDGDLPLAEVAWSIARAASDS